MDKKLKVYLNHDAEIKEYSIVPPELEAYHIFAFFSQCLGIIPIDY